MLDTLAGLIRPLPPFDRISIGFPGVVRRGRVITAPNLGTKAWRGFALQSEISRLFDRPARLENDAEVAGLGVIAGKGLEVVVTLGTGFGSAIFSDGRMTPHLELAHHPVHKSETYDEHVGEAALKAIGREKWNRRVLRVMVILHTLLNYDTLHVGGGNATNVTFKLPKNVVSPPTTRASPAGSGSGTTASGTVAEPRFFRIETTGSSSSLASPREEIDSRASSRITSIRSR